MQFVVRVSDIKWAPSNGGSGAYAKVDGTLRLGVSVFTFTSFARYDAQKRDWTIRNTDLYTNLPREYLQPDNVKNILDVLVRPFRLISLGSQDPTGAGATLAVIEGHFPADGKVFEFSSIRSTLADFYDLDWPLMWDKIRNRCQFDPDLFVSGFTREQVGLAVETLEEYFSHEWVMARYQEKLHGPKEKARASQDIHANYAFPSYCLARTALGVICVDPSWNLVMTLASGIQKLKKVPNGEAMILEITRKRNLGGLYQVFLASLLGQRGLIVEANPPTGSGSNRYDLRVSVGDRIFDIELKTITSNRPLERIVKELSFSKNNIPAKPANPVLYLFVLADEDGSPKHFGPALQAILDQVADEIFPQSVAVASLTLATVFVDASGGYLNWKFERTVTNHGSPHTINTKDLEMIFQQNWEKLVSPIVTDSGWRLERPL